MDMGSIKPFDVVRPANPAAGDAGVAKPQQATGLQAVATQTQEAVTQPAEIERGKLETAVSDIQDFVQTVRRDINFALDDDSGRMVINVTEASSGDVIRQIPSEEALRLAENLTEIRSVLFEAEA